MAVKRGSEGRNERVKRRKQPATVSEEDASAFSVEDSKPAEQCYCVVSGNKRFGLLATFLKKNLSKKITVVFASPKSLAFHQEALKCLGLDSVSISERQTEHSRTIVLEEFENLEKGVLLCTNSFTDGFKAFNLDWIVQFEPPENGEAFLRRISGERGRGLLFLLPGEVEFLTFLKESKIALKDCDFREIKIANAHEQLQKLVDKNYRVHRLAHDAYRAYIIGYSIHAMSKAFNVKKLDVHAAAASFGIKCPPKLI